MTPRSEARTQDAWKGFDLWATWIVPLLIAVPGALLWASGYGKGATGCCGAPTVPAVAPSVPAAVSPPVIAPATPPVVAPPVATAPAEPVVDCNTILQGVTVGFAVNRAELTAAGRRALDQTIRCLGDGNYEVAGHTDADGSDASNQRLSEARARAAVSYLVSKDVAASRLTSAGYGESKPIADNTSAEGKAKNRRITFTPR
jgi:OmpA-OmpF porin, OOP family